LKGKKNGAEAGKGPGVDGRGPKRNPGGDVALRRKEGWGQRGPRFS